MRIVKERAVLAGAGRLRSGKSTMDIKEYFDRVAKYIPAEVIAAYISANGLATLSQNPGTLFTLIFVVCVVCTPVYITRFTSTRKEAWTNGVMAVVAFIVWAYATGGGLIRYLDWYDAPTASVILVLFTLVSGAVVPVARQEPPKAQTI
ncbi:MAG: hypothetical protein MRJ68_16400 [Nitrospira sp.]|nr:hypothetical protein [Nitrospira sp.]